MNKIERQSNPLVSSLSLTRAVQITFLFLSLSLEYGSNSIFDVAVVGVCDERKNI